MNDKETLEILSEILRLKPDADGVITEPIFNPFADSDDFWKYTVSEEKLCIERSSGGHHEGSFRQFIWNKLGLQRVCNYYKDQYTSWEEQNGGVPYVETEIVSDSDDDMRPQYSYDFIRGFWQTADDSEEQSNLKLVMAEYGMGKSSFCQGVRRLASEEIKEPFLNGSASFPFVFNLNDYRNRDFDEFIQNRLIMNYGVTLEYKTFVKLCQRGVFSVVLDAWDQMNDTPKATVVRQNILEFSGLWKDEGRVLITCRRSFYQKQLHIKKDCDRDYSEIQRAKPYTLCGFGKRSVLQYFEFANKSQSLFDRAVILADDNWVNDSWRINSELLSRPLNLRLLLRHFDAIAAKCSITTERVETFSFLKAVYDSWKESVDDRLRGKDILKPLVILTLASGLYRSITIERYKRELEDDNHWDDVVSALKGFDFISVDGGEIEFRLAAYQEFLWAKYVLEELEFKMICGRDDLLNRFMLPFEVRCWVADELKNKKVDWLAVQIDLVRYKHFADVGYSGSNAITLLRDLNREKYYAKQLENAKKDLRFRPFDEADLRGLDLSGADFTQSSLIDADLSYTRLDSAVFSGANLSGATWDEYDHMEKCAFIEDTVVVGTRSGRVLTYNIGSRQEQIADLANEMIRAITADSFGVYTAGRDGWVGYISKTGELKNAFIASGGLQSITSGGSVGSVYVGAEIDGIFRYNWKSGSKHQIILPSDAGSKTNTKVADIHYYSTESENYIAYITDEKKQLILLELDGMERAIQVGDAKLNSRGLSFGDICFAGDNMIYSVTGKGVFSLPVEDIEANTDEKYLLSSNHQLYKCQNPVELCWAGDSKMLVVIEKTNKQLDSIICIPLCNPQNVQNRDIYWLYGRKNYAVQANSVSGFSASRDGKFIALSGGTLSVLELTEDYYQLVREPIEARISCADTAFKGCIGLSSYQKKLFSGRDAIL